MKSETSKKLAGLCFLVGSLAGWFAGQNQSSRLSPNASSQALAVGSIGAAGSDGASFAERRPGYDTAEYKAHVEELLSHTEPKYHGVCRKMLMGESVTFGQAYQDWYVIHNAGFNYRKWGDGWYMDIGTNEPMMISNTLMLDKCLGFQGICVEAQERYHKSITKLRGCQLVPHCVLGKAKKVKTTGNQGLFTVKNDNADGEEIECKGVLDVIAMLDPKPELIDFTSIDIEGAEGNVLECFPFKEVAVDYWLVETNKQPQVAVDWFFSTHGYSAVRTFGDSGNGGYFLDTLYHRKPPGTEKVPLYGEDEGTMITAGLDEKKPYPFMIWPRGGGTVSNSGLGPGKGRDWLACKE